MASGRYSVMGTAVPSGEPTPIRGGCIGSIGLYLRRFAVGTVAAGGRDCRDNGICFGCDACVRRSRRRRSSGDHTSGEQPASPRRRMHGRRDERCLWARRRGANRRRRERWARDRRHFPRAGSPHRHGRRRRHHGHAVQLRRSEHLLVRRKRHAHPCMCRRHHDRCHGRASTLRRESR